MDVDASLGVGSILERVVVEERDEAAGQPKLAYGKLDSIGLYGSSVGGYAGRDAE